MSSHSMRLVLGDAAAEVLEIAARHVVDHPLRREHRGVDRVRAARPVGQHLLVEVRERHGDDVDLGAGQLLELRRPALQRLLDRAGLGHDVDRHAVELARCLCRDRGGARTGLPSARRVLPLSSSLRCSSRMRSDAALFFSNKPTHPISDDLNAILSRSQARDGDLRRMDAGRNGNPIQARTSHVPSACSSAAPVGRTACLQNGRDRHARSGFVSLSGNDGIEQVDRLLDHRRRILDDRGQVVGAPKRQLECRRNRPPARPPARASRVCGARRRSPQAPSGRWRKTGRRGRLHQRTWLRAAAAPPS